MIRKSKIRWGAVINAVVGVAAALSDPHVLGFLPEQLTKPVTIACLVIAAVKKSVVREEHER